MINFNQTASFSLAELTQNLDVIIRGDVHCKIKGIATIQEAKSGHITFLVNPLYKKYLPETQASAVILSEEDAKNCPVNAIICRNPYYIYAKIATFFSFKSNPQKGIHPTAVINELCDIDPSASIGAHCVLAKGVKIGANVILRAGCVIGENVEIQNDAVLDAHVILYDHVKVGQRVRIASGTVIGSDGFGLAKQAGVWHKIPQLGAVILEEDVEIGANCTIDRGAIGHTVIEKGVKLDNLIQVGHNVRIGENTAIAGCVGISGSVTIGKNCLIGGAAGLAGHITLSDNVIITGGTEVTKSIREPGTYSSGVGGVVTHIERRKNSARLQRLDTLMQRVRVLEIKLKELIREK